MSKLDILQRSLDLFPTHDLENLSFLIENIKYTETIFEIEKFGLLHREMILQSLDSYKSVNDSEKVLDTIRFVENFFIVNN